MDLGAGLGAVDKKRSLALAEDQVPVPRFCSLVTVPTEMSRPTKLKADRDTE
jgi:hypothetical protein